MERLILACFCALPDEKRLCKMCRMNWQTSCRFNIKVNTSPFDVHLAVGLIEFWLRTRLIDIWLALLNEVPNYQNKVNPRNFLASQARWRADVQRVSYSFMHKGRGTRTHPPPLVHKGIRYTLHILLGSLENFSGLSKCTPNLKSVAKPKPNSPS